MNLRYALLALATKALTCGACNKRCHRSLLLPRFSRWAAD
jgi:hypothetical protein